MTSTTATVKQFLVGLSLLGTMSLGILPSDTYETVEKPAVAAGSLNSSGRPQLGTAELFSRLIERHHWQEARLGQFSMVRTYKVENDKDRTLAEEVVISYTRLADAAFSLSLRISARHSGRRAGADLLWLPIDSNVPYQGKNIRTE